MSDSRSGCPPEDVLSEYALGGLCQSERDEMARHIDVCLACRLAVGDIVGWEAFSTRAGVRGPERSTSASVPGGQASGLISLSQGMEKPWDWRPSDNHVFSRGGDARSPFLGLLLGPGLPNGIGLRKSWAGGMGEVYEVHDEVLDQVLALKTVPEPGYRPAGQTHFFQVRLKAEVQLARRVTHPNVCRIVDYGLHWEAPVGRHAHATAPHGRVQEPQNGMSQPPRPRAVPFLTMERVDGPNLGDFIRARGPLSLPEADRVLRGVLDGLQAIHDAGIVHRDLKPENVLLRACDEGFIPVLTDMGLARAVEGPTDTSGSRPTGGRVRGELKGRWVTWHPSRAPPMPLPPTPTSTPLGCWS